MAKMRTQQWQASSFKDQIEEIEEDCQNKSAELEERRQMERQETATRQKKSS